MSIDIQSPGLQHARQTTEAIRSYEANQILRGLSACPQYESRLSSYDDSFSRVTPRGGIKKILVELASEKGSNSLSVLDVAGQGTPFLECIDSGLQRITALSLGDYRSDEQKASETASGLEYIAGDIFDSGKRAEIAKNKYDLISFRPSGGRHIVSSPEIGFDLLSFIYSCLGDNGVILMELSENMLNNLGTGWVDDISKTKGLEVRFSSPHSNRASYLLLRKKIDGPKEISSTLSQSTKSQEHAFFIDTLTWERSDVMPFE